MESAALKNQMTIRSRILIGISVARTHGMLAEKKRIDEIETIEHTKLKPVTIPVCVNSNYQIIATSVGKIRAKGHLSEISVKKYGFREDEREKALIELMEKIVWLNFLPFVSHYSCFPSMNNGIEILKGFVFV